MAELYSKLNQTLAKSKSELDDIAAKYRPIVENALLHALEGNSELSVAASEIVSAGGKRIRAIMALLTCEAVCGSYEKAIPVAVAYELAHAASLVQDDIIDDSNIRRKQPTAHKKYGVTRAILISDYLIFEIFSELAKYYDVRLSKKKLTKLLLYVANSAKMVAKGEYLESKLVAVGALTEAEYLEIIGLKTGALFAAPTASGAVVGGASKRVVDAMYQFGYNLGIGFQLMDDMLDIIGNTRVIGKPVFKDLQNNTCNVALVHALSHANPYQMNLIHSMLWRRWFTPSDVKKIISTLMDLGSLTYAASLTNKYCSMSRNLLHCLPPSKAREKLEKLTEALENRSE
ncbi:MAG: polyprenyl synthetase family protein [Thaumarchaeota archaeon]|nr:polyprenyl synthetase family protein [Nitrososphaerota archaeon]